MLPGMHLVCSEITLPEDCGFEQAVFYFIKIFKKLTATEPILTPHIGWSREDYSTESVVVA